MTNNGVRASQHADLRRTLLVVVLLLGVVAPLAAQESLKDDAIDAMTLGDYSTAARLFRSYLQSNPNDARSLVNYVDCILRLGPSGDLADAERCARQAYVLDGTPRSAGTVGRVLVARADRIGEAETLLRAKIKAYGEAASFLTGGGMADSAGQAREKARNLESRLEQICRSKVKEAENQLIGNVTLATLRDCEARLGDVQRLDPGRADAAAVAAKIQTARQVRQSSLRDGIEAARAGKEWRPLVEALQELRLDYPSDPELLRQSDEAKKWFEWERQTESLLGLARQQRNLMMEVEKLLALRDSAAVALKPLRHDSLRTALRKAVEELQVAGNVPEAEKWILWAEGAGFQRSDLLDWKLRLRIFWRKHGVKVAVAGTILMVLGTLAVWRRRGNKWKRAFNGLSKRVRSLVEDEAPDAAFLELKEIWENYPPARTPATVLLLKEVVASLIEDAATNGGKAAPIRSQVTGFLSSAFVDVETVESRVWLVWLEAVWSLFVEGTPWSEVLGILDGHVAEYPAIDGLAWVPAVFLTSLLDGPSTPQGSAVATDWTLGIGLPRFERPIPENEGWDVGAATHELATRLSQLCARFPTRKEEILSLLPGNPGIALLPRTMIGLEFLNQGEDDFAAGQMASSLEQVEDLLKRQDFGELLAKWADLRAARKKLLDLTLELPALVAVIAGGSGDPSARSRRIDRVLEEISRLEDREARIGLLERLPTERVDVQDMLAGEYVLRGRPATRERGVLHERLERVFSDQLLFHYLRVLGKSGDFRTLPAQLARHGARVQSLDDLEECVAGILDSCVRRLPHGKQGAETGDSSKAAKRVEAKGSSR